MNMQMQMLSQLTHAQFIRFLLVGGLNTLLSYLIFFIFIQLGFNSTVSMSFAWFMGILINFKMISKWVFQKQNNKLIFKFFALYCVTFLISIFLLKVFSIFIQNISINGMVTVGITSLLSYLGNRNFVFTVSEKTSVL
ncbi:O antigen biosynthesis protein (plasmid) [Legionella adelaidensis]|uniref:O antigen biosynthesis protein n=1 Tax=Legionella adelaidensis TaxID=45056 RepID=A0A0W0R4Q7_9GAMM|nr:GtrA family protein [Legionella adelaidensis]KTC66063.1 O antigen biosynthesis protein [Legionella adelaidensis]VEH85719.1 O antigen biosynthesis protein [Legionella adelaidensis]